MISSEFKANLNNWTLPGYMHTVLKQIPNPLGIKFDSTCRFRYVIFAPDCEIRINERVAILTPAKPTKLQLRHANKLTHEQLLDAVHKLYR